MLPMTTCPLAAWPLTLSAPFCAGEPSTLLGEPHKMHTKPDVQMMIQDLTPNNLLVDDDTPSGGMRLLLADPAMAQPIGLLQDIYK